MGGSIGVSLKRKEDERFIRGDGRYTGDIVLPAQTYALFLRSPIAHARIRSLSVAKATAMPGVVGVFTGEDVAAAGLGGVPCGWLVTDRNGQPMAEPPHPLLVTGKVRHVGDTVAMVVAESIEQARDALEAIEIDYEPLPAVTSPVAALEPGAPKVHDELPSNLCYDWEIGDKAAVDAAFARAARTARVELVNSRVVPNAMETRAANAHWDATSDACTLYMTSQNPHVIRLLMGAFVLHIPEHKLRIIAPDVGGGFGSKIYHYIEEALVTWASRTLRRPVKWTAERTDAFLTDAHARDHVTTAELAMDRRGRFLALKVDTTANLGAYLSTFAPSIPTYFYALMFSGQYATPAIHARVRAAFTHTTPVDAYRGAGRSECMYALERVVDAAAREMGLDPAEIRRRNFIPEDGFPFHSPVGVVYDSGAFAKALDMALEKADWKGFEARRKTSRKAGRLRGRGIACWIESSGAAPSAAVTALGCRAGLFEAAKIRVHPTGSVTLFTGAHSHGQGHETTFAQVVADKFGLSVDQIEVVHGDTATVPFGMGTYGSRSMAVGGGALALTADKVIEKGKRIAAHILEASVDDIVFENATFKVAGTDKELGWVQMSLAAHVPANYPLDQMEPCIEETTFYDPPNFTFPNGVFVCEVEVDPDTGKVAVEKLVGIHDVGIAINPMIVEGQMHGGVAQAIGQCLLERVAFSEEGQLLTASYMDYCLPRADDVPSIDTALNEVPCVHNPIGVKGAGEAGTTGAPAAIINAVIDALAPLGIRSIDMPATPEVVWKAIRDARAAEAA
ncbi:carbon-monoxide dehydrogenase large subunit [Tepidamorphus gemmatus]|uniref:Carbon-monoxide dehydrogenase large subunit n=1 Tax=Tepidamorphus gemmatus TaxID=747076 RepID=A0A4R3MC76_9HYPH|nr:xanthine dehydrogenase family protein molybdopterin-binding subunit [Tepidamorphus gemmatus]TCT11284.1 carbon-monoxide dehydrogenase large subunit [Tepidamorphus gemmatus]